MSGVRLDPPPAGAQAQQARPSPFVGLDPYSEEDVAFFFGRQREIELIAANLQASRLTLLYGPSGVGKSSVLRAGVVPHLRVGAGASMIDMDEPSSGRAVVVFSSWRDDPLAALRHCIAESAMQQLGEPAVEPEPPSLSLVAWLRALTEHTGCQLLIVLDQFEEYFLYHDHEEHEGTFGSEFARAVNARDLDVKFLVSIREDRLAGLDRFKGRIPSLFDNYLRIGHLSPACGREAIEGPIEQYNRLAPAGAAMMIEPALIDAVLHDVRAGRLVVGQTGSGTVRGLSNNEGDAPVEVSHLQVVMTRLWREEIAAGSRVLRRETLARLGGGERIVQAHLDEAMSALADDERDLAARVFNLLVTPSGTKIAHTVRDLAQYADVPQPALAPVLERLSAGDLRILRPLAPPADQPQEARFEIFHDVLAPAVLEWRARYVRDQERAEALERQRYEAEERTRKKVRGIGLVFGLTVLLVVAAAAAMGFVAQRARADLAQARADLAQAQALAANAVGNLDFDSDFSLLLALEATSKAPASDGGVGIDPQASATAGNAGIDALAALYQAVHETQFRAKLPQRDVYRAVFSPDGSRLLTVSLPPSITAKLWDVSSRAALFTLNGHDEPLLDAAFSADGARVVTGGQDGTARVWDAATGDELRSLAVNGAVSGVSFSPDGTVATASAGETVKVWDVASGQVRHILRGHRGWVHDVAFSPDGRQLASVALDGAALLWDAESGAQLGTLRGHTGAVVAVAYGPDGRRLATAGVDGTVRLWNLASRAELVTLQAGGPVNDLAFSPNGQLLATASSDETVALWDAASGSGLLRLATEAGPASSVAFSPDGSMLAVAAAEGAPSLVDLAGLRRQAHGHVAGITSLTFFPDGQRVATAGRDASAKIWDVAAQQELLTLQHPDGQVNDVAVSRDGSRLATAGRDGTARVWDAATGRELASLTGQAGPLIAVAFSGDGRLATAGSDGAARVWNPVVGEPPLVLAGHSGRVNDVDFSPDGRRLATIGEDGKVVLWDAVSGSRVRVWDHRGRVSSVTFSPDGKRLASAGADQTATIWEVSSDEAVRVLPSLTGWVSDLAFTPDGAQLVTGSSDRMVRLWDLDSGRETLRIPYEDAVTGLALAPDGRSVAVVSGATSPRYTLDPLDRSDLRALARYRVPRGWRPEECEQHPYVDACGLTRGN